MTYTNHLPANASSRWRTPDDASRERLERWARVPFLRRARREASRAWAGGEGREVSRAWAGGEGREASRAWAGGEGREASRAWAGGEGREASRAWAGGEGREASRAWAGGEGREASRAWTGGEGREASRASWTRVLFNRCAGRDASSHWLERWLQVRLRLRAHSVSAFHVCGCIGFVLALVTGIALAWRRGLPLWAIVVLTGASVATSLALAMVTKLITGAEELVYYRHELAIATVAVGVSWLLRQPTLVCLEITILGVGAFLMCGRVGCFFVGCCHGCPHSFGVRYREEHAAAGFPAPLVGVRLFPVQLVEAITVAVVVAVGIGRVWCGAVPGAALAWYSIVYGLSRFVLEFFRGDAARPYYGSFSEAQWLTLALMVTTAAVELAGLLPFEKWHTVGTATLALFMVVWAATGGSLRHLLHPKHVQEVAALLEAVERRSGEVGTTVIGETCHGLKLSACKAFGTAAPHVDTIAFSAEGWVLEPLAAMKLARLLSRLKGCEGQLIVGNSGIYHLVFSRDGASNAV